MMQARDKINSIMSEIETPQRKSGTQIGEQILGRKITSIRDLQPCNLEIDALHEYVERNNQTYAVTADGSNPNQPNFRGIVQRVVGKARNAFGGPMAEQETTFNASVTCSINHLFNDMVILQEYAKKQEQRLRQLEQELEQQRFLNMVNEERIRDLVRNLEEK